MFCNHLAPRRAEWTTTHLPFTSGKPLFGSRFGAESYKNTHERPLELPHRDQFFRLATRSAMGPDRSLDTSFSTGLA